MKTYEKKEYEPKKVGSMFWWGCAVWKFTLALVMVAFYSLVLTNFFDNILGGRDSFEGLMIKMQLLEILSNLTVIIFTLLIIILAPKIAIKEVKKKAVLKVEMIDDIMKKYTTNTFVLLGIVIILNIISMIIKNVTILSALGSIISYVIFIILEILYVKKVLTNTVLEENEFLNSNVFENI